jgi:hypothetical protein
MPRLTELPWFRHDNANIWDPFIESRYTTVVAPAGIRAVVQRSMAGQWYDLVRVVRECISTTKERLTTHLMSFIVDHPYFLPMWHALVPTLAGFVNDDPRSLTVTNDLPVLYCTLCLAIAFDKPNAQETLCKLINRVSKEFITPEILAMMTLVLNPARARPPLPSAVLVEYGRYCGFPVIGLVSVDVWGLATRYYWRIPVGYCAVEGRERFLDPTVFAHPSVMFSRVQTTVAARLWSSLGVVNARVRADRLAQLTAILHPTWGDASHGLIEHVLGYLGDYCTGGLIMEDIPDDDDVTEMMQYKINLYRQTGNENHLRLATGYVPSFANHNASSLPHKGSEPTTQFRPHATRPNQSSSIIGQPSWTGRFHITDQIDQPPRFSIGPSAPEYEEVFSNDPA